MANEGVWSVSVPLTGSNVDALYTFHGLYEIGFFADGEFSSRFVGFSDDDGGVKAQLYTHLENGQPAHIGTYTPGGGTAKVHFRTQIAPPGSHSSGAKVEALLANAGTGFFGWYGWM